MRLPSGSNYRLTRAILFHLVQKLKADVCYHCKKPIIHIDDFSIEHKKPWRAEPDPVESFFDLNNIDFSHRYCNYKAARKPHKYPSKELKRILTRSARRANALKNYDPIKRRDRYLRLGT